MVKKYFMDSFAMPQLNDVSDKMAPDILRISFEYHSILYSFDDSGIGIDVKDCILQ